MRETYVRPPLIAREAPTYKLAIWRYRIIALLVLLVLIIAVGYAFLKISGYGSEDPGFTGGLRAVQVLTAAR